MPPVPYEHLAHLFSGNENKSFTIESDELPKDRPKVNHATGVVAKVRWKPMAPSVYTGMFGSESTALLRMSEANFDLPETQGLTPSLAIKFTRDGIRSVNLLANVSFEPKPSFNFFANDFRINIPLFTDACAVETIQESFKQQNAWINNLGVSELARMTQAGESSKVENSDLVYPFDLWLEYAGPDPATLWPYWSDHSERPVKDGVELKWYEQLTTMGLDHGTNLFNVMARKEPLDHKAEKIAEVRLESDIVTSAFGDQRLFFKHEKKKTDFDVQGSCAFPFTVKNNGFIDTLGVKDDWPDTNERAEAWVRGSINEHSCPFAWLLGWQFDPIPLNPPATI